MCLLGIILGAIFRKGLRIIFLTNGTEEIGLKDNRICLHYKKKFKIFENSDKDLSLKIFKKKVSVPELSISLVLLRKRYK